MPGDEAAPVTQRVRGRDVDVAGRNQLVIRAGDHSTVNVGAGRADELGVPRMLPRDVPGFTGRDDQLAQLVGLAGGGRVVVSAIGGTAGVGKTALVVHAAHQLLPGFPDGQLYADLRGYTEGRDPVEPGEVLETFLRHLDVPADEVPSGVDDRSGLLRQLLAGRRVLMVLDNARTEAQLRPLLPGTGESLVLVTSRSVLAGLEVDERVSLDVLPEDEAAAMLARVIRDTRAAAEPQAVAEVAWLCGRLPLALRIAGQLLNAHPAWPVDKLAGMLAGEADRLTRLGVGDLQVRAAFEVSYKQLSQEDARLFRLLSLYPGPDFNATAAGALAGTQPAAAELALGRLAEAHLVTEDGSGRFGLHDLLGLFARITCQETDSAADREAAEARLVGYLAGLAWFLDSCVDPQLRPAAEQAAKKEGRTLLSMREAREVFQAERPGLLAALGLAVQRGWDEQVTRFSDSMADALTVLRYLDDLLTVHEAALAATRSTGDRHREGMALINLGNAYQQLERLGEAVKCYEQSLVIFRETDDRHSEGATLINLGSAYEGLGRLGEAVKCYEQSLVIFRETGDRHSEGMNLINLGSAYEGLGRLGDAVGYYQQSLVIFRETGDPHHEGMTLNNLGSAYQELRLFKDAVGCYQQSLAIRRETGDRYREAMTLGSLGVAYEELRLFEKAIGCYEQSLVIFRETGDRHGQGMALGSLGSAYQQLRQPGRAAECWREAAMAMRDAGHHDHAQRLDQFAVSAQSRRRWRLHRRPPS
jgi:tetratricopeptide (TPR) repeat protein